MSWISGWWKDEKKEEKPVLKDGQTFLGESDIKKNNNYSNKNNWTDEYGYGFLEAIYKQFKANKYLAYTAGSEAITFYYIEGTLERSGGYSYRFIFENIVINNKETLEVRDNNSKNYTKVFLWEKNSGSLDQWGKKREYRADKVSIILEQTKDANIMFSEENKININRFYRNTEDENKKVYLTVNYGLSISDYLMINGICPDYNTSSKDKIKITVSGKIPLWVYDNLLPLSTKGYINEEGNVVDDSYTETKYQILGINDAFYENIESSIDFGERTDIDFEKFENFYVKNVKLSISYYGQTFPFKYYENGVLKDSIIDYYSNESEDIESIDKTNSSTGGYVLTIHFNPQTGNDFLDKYIREESGNKILLFNVISTELDESVQNLTGYSFGGNLIIIDQMIREENGNTFTIECCSKQIQGIRIICSTGTIECPVYPDYKITNLYCINTNDLNLNDELPEINLTLSTQQYITLTYDNLYLTNLKKEGAKNTNLVLEGNITSLYEYLPLKRSNYPEGYPNILKDINTINDSPPNEYLNTNISMCLINIENVDDIDISKFGEGVAEDGSIIKQNVFISSITAYRNDVIKNKFIKSKLKSRNQVISHSKTLGEGEVEYADTQYRFGNPNLVQSINNSDETNYEAIQLYFANQYNNEFLNDEITNDGDDWNLIIDLNNKPTDPNDSNSPSTSDQFRSRMNNNDSLLLFVKRLETIGNISFWNGKNVTNIQIYYYNENGEYVNEPKTFTKFKTKIEDAYCANTYEGEDNKIYLSPITYEFSTGKIIVPANEYENMIDIINNLYVTGKKFNNNNNKVIRSQKINLFINGTIPAWIFKDVLPLMIKTETETHYRFIESSGYVYRAETGDSGDLQIIGINDKPNIENVFFPSIGMNGYTGSLISLDSGDTAVANTNAFDRMMVGTNKIFFVNKVTLLERFKERINIEGVFQYYEGDPITPKNCVYNAEDPENGNITYVDDWALKLPDCYEGCEINQNDSTQLIMNFGIYEQLDPDAYLLKNVLVNNYMLYLDISMSTIDVRNISKVKLYLEKLKYFNSKKDITYGIYTSKDFSSVVILFNMDGFIASKSLNYMNVIDVINKCYVIGGINKLENSIRLVEPLKNAFMIYDNKKCIAFRYENRMATTINEYKCTNTVDYYNDTIRKINLLVAGEIPTWLMEYMPLPIKLNKLTHDTTYGSIFEFTNGDDYSLQIISVNALPTPDGDVGIDNIN